MQPHGQLEVSGELQSCRSRYTPGRRSRLLGLAPLLALGLVLAAGAPSARGQTSVTLAWDPSSGSGIAGYRLYRGGASRTYTDVIAVGSATTATASSLVSGATYFFAVTALGTNGLESDFSSEVSYTVPLPTNSPPSGLTFAADSGTITGPFVKSGGTLSQSATTGITGGGRAAYSFNVVNAGNYLVSAMVIAPSQAENSLYVNIDAEPTDPLMIWDIPVSSALTNATVSWRGTGNSDPATAQYVPKAFYLSAGAHQLIIVGREANTTLGTITIAARAPRLRIGRGSSGSNTLTALAAPAQTPFTLFADGPPGQVFSVLASPDLVTWTIIGTMTLDDTGVGEFTDPASSTLPLCYYRLQSQ